MSEEPTSRPYLAADVPKRIADGAWPKITVVTPSYNQAKFLEATLRSVICQGYPNLEYIVIDGGSSDGSAGIIESYSTHISYWHSKQDSGQADALATGFSLSTGDILCWLNSDDVLLPGALHHVAAVFRNSPRTGFIYGNRLVIDETGEEIGHHIWPMFLTRYHWARGQYLAQECCFWRRQVYFEVGGIDRSKFFIMDYDLFYRMWLHTKFRKVGRYLGCIRTHGETKNVKFQRVREQEFGLALSTYGLRAPGFWMLRLLNRFDRMQLFWERTIEKLSR